MQKSILWVVIALLAVSCSQPKEKQAETTGEETMEAIKAEKIVAATINDLLTNPADYQDKEVAISGMVTHVCRHGGQKCFIVAEDGETQIRLVPAGEIDEFKVEMEGSNIAVKGTFRVLNIEQAEEHVEDHESKEHHAVEQSHSEAEKAEYFVEAVEIKEITQ